MGQPKKNDCQLCLAIIALVATMLVGCEPTTPTRSNADPATLREARSKGAADAKSTLEAGKLLLKEYPPMPSPAQHGEYIKLLKEKCHCEYEVVPMQEYSKVLHEEINGWNDTMKAAIQAKHGPAIFDELHAEAQKRCEARTKVNQKT